MWKQPAVLLYEVSPWYFGADYSNINKCWRTT